MIEKTRLEPTPTGKRKKAREIGSGEASFRQRPSRRRSIPYRSCVDPVLMSPIAFRCPTSPGFEDPKRRPDSKTRRDMPRSPIMKTCFLDHRAGETRRRKIGRCPPIFFAGFFPFEPALSADSRHLVSEFVVFDAPFFRARRWRSPFAITLAATSLDRENTLPCGRC